MWLLPWNNPRKPKTIKKGAAIGLSTIRRKKAREGLKAAFGKEDMVNRVYLSAVLNSQILHWHLVEFFLKYCLTGFTKMCRLQMVIDKGVYSKLLSDKKRYPESILLANRLSPFV